jgi:lysophospholipase L1-like esterase
MAADGRGDYLALGDSIAFGYDPLRPAADRSDPTNFVGYPEVVAKTLDLNLTNASCPGEASGGFISLTGVDRKCRTFYRANYPLHVSYATSQLDFAVSYLHSHPRTRLVTLNLGGNDLSLLVAQCAGDKACITNGLPALQGTLARNLKTIYAGIRDDGHYQGRVIALTLYPIPLNNPPAPMPGYRNDAEVAATDVVNRVLAAATVAAGGEVADGFGAFRATSGAFGGDPCAAGLLIRPSTPGQPCDVHPSASGREVLAGAIQTLAIQEASATLPRTGEPTIPVTVAIGFSFLLLFGGWELRRSGPSARPPGKDESLSELGEYRGEHR